MLSARAARAPFGSATGVVALGGIFPKLTGVVGAVFETFLGPSFFPARGVCVGKVVGNLVVELCINYPIPSMLCCFVDAPTQTDSA